MRKFKRKLAQILTGAGAGIITASTILPGTIAGATENGLIANIGETLEVESGDINEYIVGDEKIEYAQKSIGEEDVYAVSYNDEDVEGEEKAFISEGLIDSEEETTIAAAIKKLEAESEEVSYADVQSIVWTVETEEKVYPVNTINTEALESVYASIDDGSVLDSITGVTSVSAKSDKNEYVVFYYMPQVTVVEEETVPAETTETTETTITETDSVKTSSTEIPPIEIESEDTLVGDVVSSVDSIKKEVEIEEEAISNSGTLEISSKSTEDTKAIDETFDEIKEIKDETETTAFYLRHSNLIVSQDSPDTIDGLWEEEVSRKDSLIYTQTNSAIPILKEHGKYVAYIAFDLNRSEKPTDIAMALNDDTGSVINDIEKEWTSDNILKLTIPDKYFQDGVKNKDGEELPVASEPIRIQSLVKYLHEDDMSSDISVNIDNQSSFKVNDISSIKVNDFDVSVDIPLTTDNDISSTNVEVFINGNASDVLAMDLATFADGTLTIAYPIYDIQTIDIVVKDDVKEENIQKVAIDDNTEVIATYDNEAFDTDVVFNAKLLEDETLLQKAYNIANRQYDNLENPEISLIDMNFTVDGKEVEPKTEVNIKIVQKDKEEDEYSVGVIHFFDDSETYELRSVEDVNNISEYTLSSFSASAWIRADGAIENRQGKVTAFKYAGKLPNFDASKYNVGDIIEGHTSIDYGDFHFPSFSDYVAREIVDYPNNGIYDDTIDYMNAKIWGDMSLDNLHVDDTFGGQNLNFVAYLNPDDFQGIFKGMTAEFSKPDSWSSTQNVALACAHVTKTLGLERYNVNGNHFDNALMKVRIIQINLEAERPYVILGFATQSIDTQSGTGIMKFEIEKPKKDGRIRIKKDSNQPDAVAGGSNGQHYEGYSLEGATFQAYKNAECTDPIGDPMVSDVYGYTNYITVPAGTYWIKETHAPEGHIPNEEATKVDVVAQSGDYKHDDTSTYNLVHVVNPITTTTFKIHKTSSDPATSNGNSSYSLAGAEFKIYNSKEAAEKDDPEAWSYTFTTDESGNTNVLTGVWKGTYYIREMKAPAGFKVDKEIKEVKVLEDTTFEFSDEPGNGGITLKKTSSDPTITNGNDCYSLAGGVFGVYKTEKDANQKVNEVDKLITKADGTSNTISGLPLGTYFVKELTAPKGYNLNSETKKVTINTIGQTATVEFADVPGTDPTMLRLQKVDDSGNEMPGVSMAGAEFKVTYYNNSKWEGKGTEYTITTASDGMATLASVLPEGLPAGTFTVQETKAPAGYKLDNQIYKGSIKVLEDGTVKMDALLQGNKTAENAKDDNVFEIKNERKPEGSTDAIDKNTGVQSGVVGTTTITDTFTYKNLYEGRTYTLDGVLLDKETGKPLLVDGKEIRVTKEFTPTSPNGKVEIDFEVKTTALAGKSTVVGETLKQDDKEVIVHVDVNDKRQEVKFPSVGTKAIDKNSGIQAGVNAKTTYVDTVSYTNLDVGSEYKVTGVLMDKETGKELTINGKTVTGSQTFTPSAENGTVKVEFNIDASSLANKSVVVFEKLYIIKKDGTEVEVGKHENINDGGQEIATPEVGTSAEDFQTKNHTAVVGKTTLIDTVNYKNLIPNKEYTMTGTLMDKETGKPVVVDGKTITNSATFTPSERSGSIEIKFEFDTSSLEGKDTVFYEKLFYNGVELTSHENPEDDEQKIDIPKIRTTAIDGQTKNHTGVTGQTTIVDTVKYENLTVGQKYVMEGVLMDKATGKELTVAGKTVTATQEFTPKTQDGTVDVTFTLDASDLKGKDVVVFETLMQGKVKITEHKSINDKGQTVNYAEVRTKAINKETQNQTNTAVGKTTILDTVSYKNLTVGQEYIMQGKLVDKATGEYLKDENGEDIVNRITFTPKQPTGMVEVPIEVDTSILHGKKIVVFEKLYQDDIEVTAHEDIEDIPQNTEVPTLKTTATDIQTGNHTGVAEETTIIDDVEYTGLTIGQKYIVKGVLMDKTTGEPVVIDGKEIISEQEFVVGEDVEYTHPSMTKEDETKEDTKEEVKDETKEETKEDTKEDVKEEVKEDTKEEVKEEDKEEDTEEAYEPIEGVTSDGTVKLFYDLNARELKGHQVVVFETLYQIPTEETPAEGEEETEPVKIISHEDIEDEGQTVDIPDAQTTATDKNTTTHTAVVGKTTIVDEVRFTGLTVGETYTFRGVLVDKETGEPLVQDGKEVTAEAEMVAETKDGSQLLEFEVDTEVIAGRSVVAEEEVWYKDVMITDHKDLEDEDQTVNVPTIATTATGQNGKTVEYGSSVTIVDTVTYTNLTVGESYTMSGTMVDQNGNAVSNVESVPFVANSANGSVEVEFVIDTTAHAGEKLVAFEELTAQNGTKITEHKDLTDEGQTVYVNTPPEVPPTTYNPTPNTGNNSGVIMAAGIAGGTAIVAAGLALGKRKKREE